MAKERRLPSQQTEVNAERQSSLQPPQRDFSLFRQTPEGEEVDAIDLRELALEMKNPSFEQLVHITGSLVQVNPTNLRALRHALYNAEYSPTVYFSQHGVPVGDIDTLRAGSGNLGTLLDEINHKFDYETGELQYGAELNPNKLAIEVYEQIQVRNGERQLFRLEEKVRTEPNLKRRYRKGLALKREVLDFIDRAHITFHRQYDTDRPIEPTWENLTRTSRLTTHTETINTSSIGSFGVTEAVHTAQAAILRYPLEKKLERLPEKDKERFNQLRLQYGAKAANLILLTGIAEDINRLNKDKYGYPKLVVPEFMAVPVDSYRAWKERTLVDDHLRPYYEWASGLKTQERWLSDDEIPADYMVRSSAVFSEDGENVTGAGVYTSVRVHRGSSFNEFKKAVTQVYASTDSPQAQAYRAQHGIDYEEMGLVIQRFIPPPYSYGGNQSYEGYMNSKLAGVPQLMEIVTKTSRNFVNRNELDFRLALVPDRDSPTFRDVHHFPPDQYKIDPELPIKVAQLAYIVERIWGKDIQVEFVAEGNEINVVQVRDLLNKERDTVEVTFPDEEPIHTGAALGVGDIDLPVLHRGTDNSQKAGITVVEGNFMWTMTGYNFSLPKEGAVIMTREDGSNGHVQTLCAEKGLICIFPDSSSEGPTLPYHELTTYGRVRVVSNGIEGKVYESSEPEEDNYRTI